MNIFVGNLNFRVDENDLRNIFEEFGQVNEVKIISDKFSGRSKGFGFVNMENSAEAEHAIKELNRVTLESREMVVNKAHDR